MRKIKNKCRFAVLLVVCVIGTVSCASRNDSGDYTRVVLTTGFAQDEISTNQYMETEYGRLPMKERHWKEI